MGKVLDPQSLKRAWDMDTGLTCSGCETCFVKAHGSPVWCAECYDETGDNYGVPKATNEEA